LKTRESWKRDPEYIIEIKCREPSIRWGKWDKLLVSKNRKITNPKE